MLDLSGLDVGRYHVVEKLGAGGMAVVYKAYDTRLERPVAIKFIRKEALVPENAEKTLKRFEHEAKALAKMNHPNIVQVFDYGEYEDSPYLVMAYVKGGSLKSRIGSPLPYKEAARLLAPIARAIEYAHRNDVIHRDVKPANILINESGDALLADFGVAKILEAQEATLTGTGVGIGTPEYMAPEQCTNQVVPQTDIYALGVVFYELLVGKRPYTADTPLAVLIKQMRDPLPDPRKEVPNIPEEVVCVLLKALAKEVQNRYEDMGAFATALEKLAALEDAIVPIAEEEGTRSLGTDAMPVNRVTGKAVDVDVLREEEATPVKGGFRLPSWVWIFGIVGMLGLFLVLVVVLLAVLRGGASNRQKANVSSSVEATLTAMVEIQGGGTFVPSETPTKMPLSLPNPTPYLSPTPLPATEAGADVLQAGFEMNTDRPGADYKSYMALKMEPEECRKRCMDDTRCKAWTYVKRMYWCYLKSPIPKASRNECCVSGFRNGEFQKNTDYYGSDYRNVPLSKPSMELCKKACDDDPKCEVWTFVKPQPVCWFKEKVPDAVKDNCCISGVR